MGGTKILSTVLLAFGAIAVVVAALVIANTFAVLSRAPQELALLRCVGATAKQVRRSIRSEAAAVGVIASVIGVGLGVGLAWAIGRVATAATAGASFVTERHPGDRAGRSCRRHLAMTMLAALRPAGGNEALPAGGTAADGVQARERSGVGRAPGSGRRDTARGHRDDRPGIRTAGRRRLPVDSFRSWGSQHCPANPALINAAGGVLARLIGPAGSLAAGNAGRTHAGPDSHGPVDAVWP